MNCSASAMLWTRSALAMVLISLGFPDREFGKRVLTLAYRRLYTPLIWCLYWVTHRGGKHVEHRNHAAGKAGVPAGCGSRQAGQHPRHGGVPQDGGGSRARFRRLLGPPRARVAAVVEALHQGAGRVEGAVLPLVLRRRAERLLQLPRPPSQDSARQDGDHLRGGRRQGHEDLVPGPLPRGLPLRERAEG